jgi:hypothetical protein
MSLQLLNRQAVGSPGRQLADWRQAVIAFGLVAASPWAAAAPDQISNGSFEALDFGLGGYCYLQVSCDGGQVLGWTGNAVVIRSGNDAWGYPSSLPNWDPSFGDVLLGLQNDRDISQTLTFATPGPYVLSWMESGRSSFYATQYAVSVDGNTLETFTTTPGQSWTARSVQFTVASAGAVTVLFDGQAVSPDGTAFLDKVSLAANPVPEPTSALLMVAGAACLLVRRKKQT